VARLATADTGGRPHVVPIVFAVEGDLVWTAVDHKPKRTRALRRLENVRANPRVSLLADHYEEDWSALWPASDRSTDAVPEATGALPSMRG
jgi:PPOX class probable F420-dependent enzyme